LDFNLPVTKWDESLNSHSGHDLYNNLQESALYQHVDKPTRGPNILDIILSTNDTMVNNVIIGPEFSSSDHRIITFNIKITADKENTSKEKVPDYRMADFNKLRTLLASANWNVIHTADDINESWRIFTEILNQAVKSCVPLRNRRSMKNAKPKWWNNQIKNSLSAKKKRAYHKYSLTQDQNDKLEYERIRRKTKKLIRESKKNLEIYIANF